MFRVSKDIVLGSSPKNEIDQINKAIVYVKYIVTEKTIVLKINPNPC